MKSTDCKEQLQTLLQLLEETDLAYKKTFINQLDAIIGWYEHILVSIRAADENMRRSTEFLCDGLKHTKELMFACRHPLARGKGTEDFTMAVENLRTDMRELIRLNDSLHP
jgi:hypothetical protein